MESTKNENVILKKLDLSSQKSIREFAEDIIRTEPRLDVLIHNAGTAESKFKKTEDDVEINMATNHFGPFLLTHLLVGMYKHLNITLKAHKEPTQWTRIRLKDI